MATKEAMAMTVRSFRRSCLEGKREGEGSLRNGNEGEGDDGFSRFLDFRRFWGVEDNMTGTGFLNEISRGSEERIG